MPLPDRQKRLLPYYNFYLTQDINRPLVLRPYKNPTKHHQRPTQQKPNNRPSEHFTPFLESNALPGHFVPILKQQHEEKVPNYGTIYDELSQLKLQQPQQNYRIGRPQYVETDQNSIQQQQPVGKTVIQTYTPTEVEISTNHPFEHELYVSTVKPKIENEIYITTARPEIQKPQPYQLYNLINQDHIQPITLEDIVQYEKDKQQFVDVRKQPIIIYEQPEQIQRPILYPQQPQSTSLDSLLKKLQDSNTLPQTLTTDNIDNSIKTLVKILSGLKKQQKFTKPIVVADEEDYVEQVDNEAGGEVPESVQMFPPDTAEGGTPGRPGVDYPALSSIPQTSFNCKTQRYKGFFGDPDTNCQVKQKSNPNTRVKSSMALRSLH